MLKDFSEEWNPPSFSALNLDGVQSLVVGCFTVILTIKNCLIISGVSFDITENAG